MSKPVLVAFTSTRADYGILRPLLLEIRERGFFDLKVLVTGTHLSSAHGLTISEVEKDFNAEIIKVDLGDLQTDDHIQVLSRAIALFNEKLRLQKPALGLVLGDRFEAFGFAIVCHGLQVPIAHLHGGEVTEGALDDEYRHCITKLSDLHFTVAEEYKNRVIQMGEDPNSVFNFGSLAVEQIHLNMSQCQGKTLHLKEVEYTLPEKYGILCFHPETTRPDYGVPLLKDVIKALEKAFQADPELMILVSGTNMDPGHTQIAQLLQDFAKRNPMRTKYIESFGQKNFFTALNSAQFIIGNSSSGILEAPSFGITTINVGDRQKGRVMAQSVVQWRGEHLRQIQSSRGDLEAKKFSSPFYLSMSLAHIYAAIGNFFERITGDGKSI